MNRLCFHPFLLVGSLAVFVSGCATSTSRPSAESIAPEATEAAPEAPSEEGKVERARTLAAEAAALAHYGSSAAEIRRAYSLAGEAYEMSSEQPLLLARTALLASQLTDDTGEKATYARSGLAAAKAAARDPAVSAEEAAYYHGVHFGLMLQAEGMTAVGRLPELVALFEKAAASPSLDWGGPHRALGMLYLRAPAWPTSVGDLEQALENFETVTRAHPKFPLNQIGYAEALLEDGRVDEAGACLARAEESLASGRWGAFHAFWERDLEKLKAKTAP